MTSEKLKHVVFIHFLVHGNQSNGIFKISGQNSTRIPIGNIDDYGPL